MRKLLKYYAVAVCFLWALGVSHAQTIVYECTPKVAAALLKHYPKDAQNGAYVNWDIIRTEDGQYVSKFEWREVILNTRDLENFTNRVIKLKDKSFPLLLPHDGYYYYNAQDFYNGKRYYVRLFYDGGPFIWVYHKTGKIKIQKPWQRIKL